MLLLFVQGNEKTPINSVLNCSRKIVRDYNRNFRGLQLSLKRALLLTKK